MTHTEPSAARHIPGQSKAPATRRNWLATAAPLALSCLMMGCLPTTDASPPTIPRVQTPKAGSAGHSHTAPRATPQSAGKLTLQMTPLWAQVKANGKLVGVISYLPSGATGIQLDVPQNPLALLVQKPGYTDWKRTFQPAELQAALAAKGHLGAFAMTARVRGKTRYKRLTRRLKRLKRAVEARPRDVKRRKKYQKALVKAGRYRHALDHIAAWRRWSPRSVKLLKQHVDLQRRFSRKAARRLLTEWTEFAPQSAQTWLTYGRYLRQKKQYQQSCDAFIKVIHLNPSSTSLFQGIMAMRRRPDADAARLKRCILQGVQQMPIERKLTITMMWDQDGTDVDMWVKEPNGEEVGFQHKQSTNGGILYYDVTTGFGPEIYVNAQKPGRYRLRAVYYSGNAPQVNVTFTVMKNAGTTRATTTRHTVTLAHNGRQKQHVAWIDIRE